MNYKMHQGLCTGAILKEENRCGSLSFIVTSQLNPNGGGALHMGAEIYVEDAISVLSNNTFNQLRSVSCGFDKDCQSQDVIKIAQLLPKNFKKINISDPISPDQFYYFATNINNGVVNLSIDVWYYVTRYTSSKDERFVDLPPTQQECAYNLLLPLAIAGHPFEPPFIELHTDEDLEPVYAQLRTVPKYGQMPFEDKDGVA
jgi:hypothetical protein